MGCMSAYTSMWEHHFPFIFYISEITLKMWHNMALKYSMTVRHIKVLKMIQILSIWGQNRGKHIANILEGKKEKWMKAFDTDQNIYKQRDRSSQVSNDHLASALLGRQSPALYL